MRVVVTAGVPGMTDKDLQVSLEDGVLTVAGERKPDAPQGCTAHRRERGAFKFTRSLALPIKVDGEKVPFRGLRDAEAREAGRHAPVSRSAFEVASKLHARLTGAELVERRTLDLADALARQRKGSPDLLERVLARPTHAEAHPQHLLLPRSEGGHECLEVAA